MQTQSLYSRIDQRFKNIDQFTTITHKVEDEAIACVIRSIKGIFKTLNREDENSRDLAGLLWVFQTTLNATLVSYDDPSLFLKNKSQDIVAALKKLNADALVISAFEASVNQLWSKNKNNKFERLLAITEGAYAETDLVGLVGKIMYGHDPACINIALSRLSNYGVSLTNVDRKRLLRWALFKKIFILAPPAKPSMDLMKVIFYTGVTSEVNLILYEHENFYVPPRIELPISSNFKGHVQKFKTTKIIAQAAATDDSESELNSWVEESFWNDIHGGNRIKTAQTVAAHYILFDGGEGAFMPVQGKVLHIDKSVTSSDEARFIYDLSYVSILELTESDYVLLRRNTSGFLLNEDGEGVEDGEDSAGLLDQITDWKSALDALLLTKDYSEIANLMYLKGVHVTASKIKQWAGVDVIGPSSEVEFKALIAVLGEEGKLNASVEDMRKYSAERWASIHDYRVSRQKAGNKARQSILDTLLTRIEGLDIDSSDGAKSLDSELGQNLLIRRVASIDQAISYVHQSSLFKIDDLKGNKWLR
jgi:hypothetical protein